MNTDYKCIIPFLGHHLLLLDRADTILRVKYDDLCSRHICKSCQCCLSSVPGGCSQDHNIIFHLILLRCSSHQIRQNRKCHILECDGRPVEQLQIVSILHLCQRCDHVCIELFVVCTVNTVLQFFLGIIGEKELHHLICGLLISHSGQLLHGTGKLRNRIRNKQSSIFSQTLKDRFRCSHRFFCASGTSV